MERSRLSKALLWSLVVVVLAAIYCGGYFWLRINHHLVRDATYYTGAGGTVRTDWIRLGEGRWGKAWSVLAIIYLPARYAEALYWRSQPLGT